jgi:SAM-dependent methyltransferase
MTDSAPATTADELAERILGAALGFTDIMAIYLGDRLGWYEDLVENGPSTPDELAGRTDTHPRYAREWLEQQAVTGFLTVDDGRFAIPSVTAEVLTDPDSLAYLAPLARLCAAPSVQLPALLEAYRTGGGVSWEQLGVDAREGQADMNRPYYLQMLPGALESVPDVHAALSKPGTRIADVGCGAGWSSIAIATAYPDATVEGFDIDEPTVAMAKKNAAGAGLADRVSVTALDASDLPDSTFDVAFAFECIHDMPRPVDVLSEVRRALAPDGFLVVMDEAVADEFAPNGDELERMMYGFSLFVCLPDGLSSPPSVGTGTVMRPSTLKSYGEQAGFTGFEVLPIEDFGFWRFYRLA